MSEEQKTNDNNNIQEGIKKAASAYTGPVGGKMAELASKTKIGQQITNKGSEIVSKMPNFNKKNNSSFLESENKTNDNNSELEDGKDKILNSKSKNEKEDKHEKNNKPSEISQNDKNDEDDNKDDSMDLLSKWKKIPDYVKSIVFTNLFTFITMLGIILVVGIFVITTAVVAEKLYETLITAESSVNNFFTNAANFFSGNSESKAQKAEEKYYKKLEDIHKEFLDKYGVDIDTTMITATLFYGRTMGDYVEEDFIEENEEDIELDDEIVDEDESDYKAQIDFYKKAKKYVKTLAKYMLVQNTTFNKCVDNNEAGYTTNPESFLEIAKNFSTVSMFNSNSKLFNSINHFNYVSYDNVPSPTFTNAKEETVTINEWCNFKDADSILRKYYEDDKAYYKEKEAEYNSCVSSKKNSCINGCGDQECKSNCESADYDSECSTEKAAMKKAFKYYNENWLSEGLYTDSGSFTCKSTSKWGNLDKFSNTKYFYNHDFEVGLRDQAIEPNFLDKYSYMIDLEKAGCTNQPTIKYDYFVNTEEGGVYYYKLMIKTPDDTSFLAGIFKKKESFIERYYPDLLPDNYDTLSEEEQLEAQKQIVDEIFLLHYTVTRDRPERFCVTPKIETNVESETILGDGENYIITDGDIEVNSSSRENFLNSIASTVVTNMQNTGVLASLTLAQAAVESGNGSSGLAKNHNNYYGMKAGSCAPKALESKETTVLKAGEGGNNCTGNAFWNGDIVWMCNKAKTDCGWYRKYNSFSNSTYDHSRLLSTTRYNCQGITDLTQALQCIQNAGYATDPAYFEKITNTAKQFNLNQFDIGMWDGTIISDNGSASLGSKCFESSLLAYLYENGSLELNEDGTYSGIGEGTIDGILNGIRTQDPRLGQFYNLYWKSPNNRFAEEQCTWYAYGRALEIMVNAGVTLQDAKDRLSPITATGGANGNTWFARNKNFSFSTNVNEPKPGAIVVYGDDRGSNCHKQGNKYIGCGHVGIVEKVNRDANGNVVSVDMTDGGTSLHGFKYTTGKSLSKVKQSGHLQFIGYLYLLEGE